MDLERLQPKLFNEFKAILQSDRMNHAYLFSGDFASFEMSLYLAQSRFCDNLQDKLPCGHCRSCHLIEKREFTDLKIVEPTGQIIKTDTIKSLMREFSSSGFEGSAQVFIIRDCEKMHPNAANSLLKFIEEPQSSSYMILLTSDESKVLPTIKSRTQIFHFPKNKELLMEQAQQAGLLKSQAETMAELASSPQNLQELLQNKKNLDLLQVCQRFTGILLKKSEDVYLEVGRLVQVVPEKADQDLVFKILTILLAKDKEVRQARTYLQALYQARLMWQSNVSFQNAIEYMVIS
ncbi:DNA polymerase III subunit delta' [Streptococcus caballi]|uniref:DNA polymerase III subunit delta' n=1 Tax=Streptococcus caballi TaxID=439220 RepID=UPI000373543E|nr:DNA polymerase III subunit delta' [Streptococcus caballi]